METIEGVNACPRCGASGDRIYETAFEDWSKKGHEITLYMGCLDCCCVWEPFRVEDLATPADPCSIFKGPCDNCAFRPGSPERNDPVLWEKLQQDIYLRGGAFYCHKGLPLSSEPGQTHDHPKRDDGQYDTDKMRLCAGYLAQRLGRIYGRDPHYRARRKERE